MERVRLNGADIEYDVRGSGAPVVFSRAEGRSSESSESLRRKTRSYVPIQSATAPKWTTPAPERTQQA